MLSSQRCSIELRKLRVFVTDTKTPILVSHPNDKLVKFGHSDARRSNKRSSMFCQTAPRYTNILWAILTTSQCNSSRCKSPSLYTNPDPLSTELCECKTCVGSARFMNEELLNLRHLYHAWFGDSIYKRRINLTENSQHFKWFFVVFWKEDKTL